MFKFNQAVKTGLFATSLAISSLAMANATNDYPMVEIPGAIVYGTDTATTTDYAMFQQGRKVTLGNFALGKYEVDYALWHEVRTYAENQLGYYFYNKGQGGSQGTEGAVPNYQTKDQPVVKISWNDAIVWANAYSQMQSKTPVYTDTNGYILNDSSKTSKCANAVMHKNANGFRLPTEAEWEFAARGADSNSSTWGNGRNHIANQINYASNQTSDVNSFQSGKLGLYHMAGNVWEWCFDPWANLVAGSQMDVINPHSPVADDFFTVDITTRSKRGGSYKSSDTDIFQTGYRKLGMAKFGKIDVGFRLARYTDVNGATPLQPDAAIDPNVADYTPMQALGTTANKQLAGNYTGTVHMTMYGTPAPYANATMTLTADESNPNRIILRAKIRPGNMPHHVYYRVQNNEYGYAAFVYDNSIGAYKLTGSLDLNVRYKPRLRATEIMEHRDRIVDINNEIALLASWQTNAIEALNAEKYALQTKINSLLAGGGGDLESDKYNNTIADLEARMALQEGPLGADSRIVKTSGGDYKLLLYYGNSNPETAGRLLFSGIQE